MHGLTNLKIDVNMLHHICISIGSDDVTMLRLQLFFFHTLRPRHIHVKRIYQAAVSQRLRNTALDFLISKALPLNFKFYILFRRAVCFISGYGTSANFSGQVCVRQLLKLFSLKKS